VIRKRRMKRTREGLHIRTRFEFLKTFCGFPCRLSTTLTHTQHSHPINPSFLAEQAWSRPESGWMEEESRGKDRREQKRKVTRTNRSRSQPQ
jgi:hypothetical protein